MDKSFNKQIIQKICALVPPYIKVVDYLMDTLGIGRESAYRRIRSQVPFSLDEIALLSSLLNFSLDEMIGIKQSAGMIRVKSFTNPMQTSDDIIYRLMEDYCNHLIKGGESNDLEIVVASNRILFFYLITQPHLLKFFYYKCCRQNNDIPINTSFAEVKVPERITGMARTIWQNIHNIRKETFIFDKNNYFPLLKEIQFYYFRKLITEEDLVLLKEDLLSSLSHVETLSRTGKNRNDIDTMFYLSSLDVESNLMLVKYNGNSYFTSFLSSYIPIYITDVNVCNIQEKWIDSLKKYSVLITESNEMDHTDFFRKQYQALEKLGKEPL